MTPLDEWILGTSDADRIYVDQPGASFANLRMIAQTIWPWGASPDRDIEDYAGSLPEPAAVKLPQDG